MSEFTQAPPTPPVNPATDEPYPGYIPEQKAPCLPEETVAEEQPVPPQATAAVRNPIVRIVAAGMDVTYEIHDGADMGVAVDMVYRAGYRHGLSK